MVTVCLYEKGSVGYDKEKAESRCNFKIRYIISLIFHKE